MARSLRNGDFDLVLAIQSPSSPDRWYRVLLDRARALTGETVLSCDCTGWKQNARNAAARRAVAAGHSDAGLRVPRGCKHTDAAQALLGSPAGAAMPRYRTEHPYVGATRTRWAPLREFVPEGGWGIQEARITVSDEPYHLVLLQATGTTDTTATAAIAFAACHPVTLGSRAAPIGDWGGYTLAASFCRQAGVPLAGEPPLHFAEELIGRGATRRSAPQPGTSNREILAIGDQRDLGDGLTPAQRAENTLRLFLGPQHALLERQGFLDVSSGLYPGRVYRLRRDPQRRYERRVRVFEQGQYRADYCIVRAQSVPEADQYLTVYFGLIADERRILSVVQRGNIFSPNSDGQERETVPAVWRPRAAALTASA
ncbi:MAG: hypothetical protein HGA45_11230 [Chloroflexales bacterium]|nr:hypothetical protein [Chloroflexales bacterium]